VQDAVEGEIDFDGQRRSEVAATVFFALSAIIAFNVGYISNDIALTIKVGLAGSLLTFLVTIPAWPFWKVNPVKWLPAGSAGSHTIIPSSQ